MKRRRHRPKADRVLEGRKEPRRAWRQVLRAGVAIIQTERDIVHECHVSPVTGEVDALGRRELQRFDRWLDKAHKVLEQ
jgi:hypothetical protein